MVGPIGLRFITVTMYRTRSRGLFRSTFKKRAWGAPPKILVDTCRRASLKCCGNFLVFQRTVHGEVLRGFVAAQRTLVLVNGTHCGGRLVLARNPRQRRADINQIPAG